MNYYVLAFNSIVSEYISINMDGLRNLSNACASSEFHMIDRSLLELFTEENGGYIFPDFYCRSSVSLFSERIYHSIAPLIPEAFVKPAVVCSEYLGESRKYMLVVPPSIECADLAASKFSIAEINPLVEYYTFSRFVIDSRRTGNFNIFRTAYSSDRNIYITHKLMNELKYLKPEGVTMYQYDR